MIEVGLPAAPGPATHLCFRHNGVSAGTIRLAKKRLADEMDQPVFRDIRYQDASLRRAANSSGRDQRDTVDNRSTNL